MLPSSKCLDDIESLKYSFLHVYKSHLKQFKGAEIIPARFNIAENVFVSRGDCSMEIIQIQIILTTVVQPT